jgi:hypothetical protein
LRNTVLVVTNQEDLHASAVIAHLHEMGVRVFRLNTENLLTGHTLSLSQTAQGDTLQLHDHVADRRLEGADIGVVYFRRPAPPEVPAHWEGHRESADVVAAESRWFLRWLYAYLGDVPWFTADPLTLDRAACKPSQIRLARRLGMQVPDTYYGNGADTIAALAAQGPLVVKAIKETGFAADQVFHAFYTARVTAADVAQSRESLAGTVNFLQRHVDKRHELRVTWVDGQYFAARIHSQTGPEAARIDWRKVDWQALDYSLETLPEDLQRQMAAYCAAMNIGYGAFDFIVTPEGEHVFLECNANGQWLWIDEKTNAGIAPAIAAALRRRLG